MDTGQLAYFVAVYAPRRISVVRVGCGGELQDIKGEAGLPESNRPAFF